MNSQEGARGRAVENNLYFTWEDFKREESIIKGKLGRQAKTVQAVLRILDDLANDWGKKG